MEFQGTENCTSPEHAANLGKSCHERARIASLSSENRHELARCTLPQQQLS